MKSITFFIILIIVSSCSSYNKQTYICGDRPCINKAEKEEYFKKNMIIEVKKNKKEDKKKVSEVDQILDQALIKQKGIKKEERKLVKEKKYKDKELRRREKELAKQLRLEKKRKIKEEKKLAKLAKKNKKLNKSAKKISKQQNMNDNFSDFQMIVDNIYNKNTKKKYPDINKIPK